MPSCLSSCIRSRLTHQLLGRSKSTIRDLRILLPERRILRSWGWESTIHAGFFEFAGEQVLSEGQWPAFWNPVVFSEAIIPRRRPNWSQFNSFFLIVASIVYDCTWGVYVKLQRPFGVAGGNAAPEPMSLAESNGPSFPGLPTDGYELLLISRPSLGQLWVRTRLRHRRRWPLNVKNWD